MSKYLHLFETNAEFETAYNGNDYHTPWVSFTKNEDEVNYNKYDPTGGFEYVDLGLPSGNLWATCNIGASSPEEMGAKFAWGEVKSKETYTWDNYKFFGGVYDNYGSPNSECTKYNSTDNKVVLDLTDDACYKKMGKAWQIPSMSDYTELAQNTTQSFEYYNGTSPCVKFTSNTNGNYIYIPFEISQYQQYAESSTYWVSEKAIEQFNNLYLYTNGEEIGVYFDGYGQQSYIIANNSSWYPRCNGNPIRGIMKQN